MTSLLHKPFYRKLANAIGNAERSGLGGQAMTRVIRDFAQEQARKGDRDAAEFLDGTVTDFRAAIAATEAEVRVQEMVVRFELTVAELTADAPGHATVGAILARRGTSIGKLAAEFLDREKADNALRAASTTDSNAPGCTACDAGEKSAQIFGEIFIGSLPEKESRERLA